MTSVFILLGAVAIGAVAGGIVVAVVMTYQANAYSRLQRRAALAMRRNLPVGA